jgi:hypothetical protein
MTKPERLFAKEDSEMKKALQFKYATWNVRRLGEKEKLQKNVNYKGR